MKFIEPEKLEVISISNYEHVLYLASDGRAFLTLTHESGLMPYSETILLTSAEKISIESNRMIFIDQLRETFSHESKCFGFHGGTRAVSNFDNWKTRKAALVRWHEKGEAQS